MERLELSTSALLMLRSNQLSYIAVMRILEMTAAKVEKGLHIKSKMHNISIFN